MNYLNYSSQQLQPCDCSKCKKFGVCKFVESANKFKRGIENIKSENEIAFNPLIIELKCKEFEKKPVVNKSDTFFK